MYTLHQLISVCKHEAGASATRDLQLYVRKDSTLSYKHKHTMQIICLVTVDEYGGGGERGGGVGAVLFSVVYQSTHCLFFIALYLLLIAFHKVLNLSA